MEEKNKKSLDDAIRNLPQYEPKASLWDAIDSGLSQTNSDVILHQTIAELPSYSPPDFVWEHILQELETDVAPKTATIRHLAWVKYAAAACVGLLLLFGANHFSKQTQPLASNDIKVRIGYSKETIRMPQAYFDDIEVDQEAFQLVSKICQQELPVCENPLFKELRMELKDLDIARKQLDKYSTSYDTDPTHLIQMARLERDRSDVLKKMVAMI